MISVTFRQILGLVSLLCATWLYSQCRHIWLLAQDDFNEQFTNFLGEKWWSTDQLELCDDETKDTKWQKNDSICITYVYNMLPVDMEIISWAPTLVIYRNLMSPRQTASFLNFIEQRDLEIQKTSDFGTSIETTHRRANGSFIPPEDSNVTVEIKMQAQKRIPGLNLTVAEHFSALSYLPGGHYAVHYDYLDYRSKQDYDWWMNKTGNRIGTLIFVLKPAEKGGGTVFPSIGSTVRANAGDAFFWFNAQADEEKEMLSNHGGCPIYEGRKVIATIWIRAYNQRILPMAPAGSSIHASWLIPSLSNRFRPEMQTQSPVPN